MWMQIPKLNISYTRKSKTKFTLQPFQTLFWESDSKSRKQNTVSLFSQSSDFQTISVAHLSWQIFITNHQSQQGLDWDRFVGVGKTTISLKFQGVPSSTGYPFISFSLRKNRRWLPRQWYPIILLTQMFPNNQFSYGCLFISNQWFGSSSNCSSQPFIHAWISGNPGWHLFGSPNPWQLHHEVLS